MNYDNHVNVKDMEIIAKSILFTLNIIDRNSNNGLQNVIELQLIDLENNYDIEVSIS